MCPAYGVLQNKNFPFCLSFSLSAATFLVEQTVSLSEKQTALYEEKKECNEAFRSPHLLQTESSLRLFFVKMATVIFPILYIVFLLHFPAR